ncbi:hypothetical protein KQ874_02580 [Mycoplasma sp. ES3157-GEN-MYC]|uniref:Uncharacterized protein n=1 Tax=Mycoplasma miroungigenitalium TaxID=754515 RepID=A0A6M4J9R9_9MOLU|nr:hypothetical protein [Mycoplasma miroungigenitalium]MBU4690566.1 hypothetical protein [Mycoplasma miroungigenitalium]MBU4691833.1 hypothetical protein [Mycoplasma miroungigenitalium]QJR43693.1 hypothetical protein HLA87_02780 [Mycoplasma miroungigenitalium]
MFKTSLDEYEFLLKELEEKQFIKEVENVRTAVNKSINKLIKSMSGNIIVAIFNNILNSEKGIIDVIRDYETGIDEPINTKNLHFLERDWIVQEIKNIDLNHCPETNKKSYRILNSDNSKTPFRLRIELNNGVESLMIGLKLLPEKK